MKLEINLDESRFKDLVDEELGSFSKDEIHDILKQAMEQYVMDSGTIKNLFCKKKRDYYGRETDEFEETDMLKRVLSGIDVSPVIERLRTDIENVLKEDDIIRRLSEGIFYRILSGRIDEMIWNSSALSSLIQTRVNQMLNERR